MAPSGSPRGFRRRRLWLAAAPGKAEESLDQTGEELHGPEERQGGREQGEVWTPKLGTLPCLLLGIQNLSGTQWGRPAYEAWLDAFPGQTCPPGLWLSPGCTLLVPITRGLFGVPPPTSLPSRHPPTTRCLHLHLALASTCRPGQRGLLHRHPGPFPCLSPPAWEVAEAEPSRNPSKVPSTDWLHRDRRGQGWGPACLPCVSLQAGSCPSEQTGLSSPNMEGRTPYSAGIWVAKPPSFSGAWTKGL